MSNHNAENLYTVDYKAGVIFYIANIAINITFSRQCSNVLLFGITRLRLSRERIKNCLYIHRIYRLKTKVNIYVTYIAVMVRIWDIFSLFQLTLSK